MFVVEWERGDYARIFFRRMLIGRIRWTGTGVWEATARLHGRDEKLGEYETADEASREVKKRYLKMIEANI